MKIYFYLKHFSPYGERPIGGTSTIIHGLATGLVACGADVTILCERQNASSFQTDIGYKIECFSNHNEAPSFAISPELKQYFRNYISEKNNTIVVINGTFHPSVYSVSRLLKRLKVPYIAAPLDIYHPAMLKKNSHLKWPYWHLFEKRMLRDSKAVQLYDRRHAKWLQKLEINNPIIEAPGGFLLEDVPAESSLKWREHKASKFFFFGRVDTHHKGLDILLDAFAQIAGATNATLTIQGPGQRDKDKLQKKATRLVSKDRVTFLEPDYDSSSLIISKYDIFCLPSRFEGFGLSALEAMLAGRVLLVSEVAGIAPHVRASGCGVVVTPEVAAIKDGLMELLSVRSEWKEMGLKGRRYAIDNLHWNKIAAAALKHYEQMFDS
ncbi:glycosyltransferase [Pleurocapsa sp. PCC 7319]|uniref:glycosyltransferase n=1 Tax=Pleurocapsa sp. PCC 7319 TaxID=118161 RepID=UPI000345BBDB|nr:glycosyltransferase [Pleurocapsa sp. PCC 7319]